MSEVKVNKISPRTNCGTVQLGDSGDTITIPAGATITNNGTQTGFGRTGTVDWDTTAKTAGFTAVSGTGYFVNTTSGAITVTLPATPSAGNIVSVSDYNGTAATNAITIGRNGSNINGDASDYIITKADSAVTFVYVDGTVGWTSVQTSNVVDNQNAFVQATGGTITCDGDFRIHTFTGPGTFTVTNAGNALGSDTVDYLVVAGGASGGGGSGGAGGGAGGYRESSGAASGCYSVSPLGSGVSALPVSIQCYPITVGGGGAQITTSVAKGNSGSISSFSTIISAGGGGGGAESAPLRPGNSGGSGGGGAGHSPNGTGGAGNTPPVSPPQGNNGANGNGQYSGGGGGGATGAGTSPGNPAGAGGAGGTSSINGTPTARAGGGGGGNQPPAGSGPGPGTDGGGNGGVLNIAFGTDATANTGGGGGGGSFVSGAVQSGAGGSGIVIIRYKYQ